MKSYELSYAKINIINDDIVEVICHEGIELEVEMLIELQDFTNKELNKPFSLLINRIHTYTYSFDVLQYFGEHHSILATAFVIYNKTSKSVTDYAVDFIKNQDWETSVFDNRDMAIDWLRDQSTKII